MERPFGGQSVIYCHGTREGRENKLASSIIVNTITERIGSGLKDGLAIETTSGRLFTEHEGKLQGDVGILSADFESGTLVISRCTAVPFYYYRNYGSGIWEQPADLFASAKRIHSSITEVPLEPGLLAAAVSPGVTNSGVKYGLQYDIYEDLAELADSEMDARDVADCILKKAILLDQNKPQADMSVIVLRVIGPEERNTTRMLMKFPVPRYINDF